MKLVTTGNEAVAEAMRQINPDVVAAYPITPSTKIPEKFSEFVANGQVETEFVPVESEHSAMSACVGAAASGARAMTATASQGLALMHEVLVNASGLRLPIVLANANRALSAPLSIHGDHSDAMMERDSGWIQFFADSPQEAYDLMIQAFTIGEHEKVRLPVMVCFDGFETSHLTTNVMTLKDQTVKKFIGKTKVGNTLFDFDKPVSFGTFTNPDYFFEIKRNQHEGMENARKVVTQIGKAFGKISKRDYSKNIDIYKVADAEVVIVVMGSAFGAVKEAVDSLRSQKKKVGAVRVRTYRPFPADEITKVFVKAKKVSILDRTMPSGAVGGPLFNEINSALQTRNSSMDRSRPVSSNYIYGIGQRQFNPAEAEAIFKEMLTGKSKKNNFVNLRG